MFGLSKKGFMRKTYPDIKESMEQRARETFGDDINLRKNSFLGMLISVTSWCLSGLWQLAENVFFNKYVDYAEGVNLDLACRNYGITRLSSEKARGQVEFNKPIDTELILSDGSVKYITTTTGKIVDVEAMNEGWEGNTEEGMITEIVTPVPGLEIISSTSMKNGRDIETDTELRKRFFESLSLAGAGTLSALQAAIINTEGVVAGTIEEVKSSEGYIIGIRPIVIGGENNDIAQTIFDKKAFGIKTIGTKSGVARALNGDEFTIYFDFAEEYTVNISVELTVIETFSENGSDDVYDKIKGYMDGLGMGDDVIYYSIISKVLEVEGVVDVNMKLNGVKENIIIPCDELATVGEIIIS